MDNFYKGLIGKIESHMEKQEYKEAFELLEEEFRMPYIPKEYEAILIPLYNTCRSELNASKKVYKSASEDDLEELLNGSLDEAFQAVDYLKNSNIRKYLDIVENYLKNRPHFLIRSLLIEALYEQSVSEEMELNYDGLEVKFTPAYIELPQEQDAFIKAAEIVSSYYENDNPSFLMMCMECMMKEMYFKLPFTLDEDEIYHFIYAILLYVYKANGDKEGFARMIDEKKLANYGGYDLLLYKYDI